MAQSWLRTYQDEINIVMVYNCEYEGCGWTTDTDNEDTYATLYKLHVGARHQNNAASKAEKARSYPQIYQMRIGLISYPDGLSIRRPLGYLEMTSSYS